MGWNEAKKHGRVSPCDHEADMFYYYYFFFFFIFSHYWTSNKEALVPLGKVLHAQKFQRRWETYPSHKMQPVFWTTSSELDCTPEGCLEGLIYTQLALSSTIDNSPSSKRPQQDDFNNMSQMPLKILNLISLENRTNCNWNCAWAYKLFIQKTTSNNNCYYSW